MRYLLDTGLLIRHLRGQKTTVRLLRSLGSANRLCISAVTRLEVKAGAHPSEQANTQKLLARFVNLDLDAATADKAGELIYKSRGDTLLVPDAIVAATFYALYPFALSSTGSGR